MELSRTVDNLRFRKEKNMNLSGYTTKELVEELKNREGVKSEYAGLDEVKSIEVDGPAEILIVMD